MRLARLGNSPSGQPARCGRAAVALLLAWPAITLVAAPGAAAPGTNRLQEITDKWRQTRGHDFPLEVYLRPLVAADSAFRRDSTLAPESLGPTARQVWDGLHYLLAPSLQQQYLGLSTDSLRLEWVRRYWRLRDPTPTTPENERLDVHLQRVREARDRFAWKHAPGWDARGAIWIQFGAPDSVIEQEARVEDGLGFVPARQQWLYLDDKWVVEFERPNPKGGWILGRSSARISYRPDLVARDRERLGYDPSSEPPTASSYERAGDIIGFQEDREMVNDADDMIADHIDDAVLRHEVRTNFRARDLLRREQESLARFRKQYEAGGERFVVPGKARNSLWYVFDVDVFKGPPGRMRVEVHYQFNLQNLKFGWQDSTYVAAYRAEGVLLDAAAEDAARDVYSETVKAADFRTTLAAQLVPGQLVFNVPEGTYRLGIRLVDLGSGDEGTYVTGIEVPRLDGRQLELSDVQMASSILYAGEDWRSRFVKNDRLVVPNPIKAYPRGRQLLGYYEVYGLKLDTDRVCHYEVKYTIAPRSLTRAEGWFPPEGSSQKPFVTSSFTDLGGTSELVQELRVDVGALDSDTYDLVLTVKDLLTGAEATARSSFSILSEAAR